MLGQEYAAEEAGVELQESGSLVSLNSSGLSESVLVGQEELRTGDVSLLRQVCSPQTLRNRPAGPVLTHLRSAGAAGSAGQAIGVRAQGGAADERHKGTR